MHTTENVIELRDVFFSYGNRKIPSTNAVSGLSLSVSRGEIYGFLGPNGAGKTTTIKLILGIFLPMSGSILLSGEKTSSMPARKKIGYMPEIADYYDYLTPEELLFFYGDIFHIKKDVLRKRVMYLLSDLGLDEHLGKKIKELSKGMKQKLNFAQALINDPDLLILDEPTSGLDPVARKQLRERIADLKKAGKTIFFSSHELSEVELLCDRISIMDKGTLRVEGKISKILESKRDMQTLESYFLQIIGENK